MKNATAPVQVTTNSTAVGHTSKIDPGAMGIVMEILSKMYTNGPRAVLREYACNGFDSHVEAGTTRPVEVSLPSDLQPSLLIRDFGTGLSKDGIINVFGTYGASTKRDTNDQVGAFGIGSKSAFVMTNAFIVTGYKDGQRTVVEFLLDENNVATAFVRKESKTDEPNGVLISIGVTDVDRMRSEAQDFFSTWEKGNVLVDGEQPESVYDSGYALSESIHVVPDSSGTVNVVMGQVAYPADRSLLRKVAATLEGTPAHPQAEALASWYESTTLYFKVPIGTVDIAPTREGLRDTETTTKVIAGLVSDMVGRISSTVQAAVDAAPNKYAAAMALEEAIDNLGAFKVRRKDFPYQGEVLKAEVKVPVTSYFLTTKNYRTSAKIVGEEKDFTADADRAPHTLVVIVPEAEESKVKRYAKRFLENTEWKWILVTSDASGETEWFQWGIKDGAPTWTLDEYRAALRALRDSNPRTVNEPSYTVGWSGSASRDLDERDLLSDIISWGKDVIIFSDYGQVRSAFATNVLDPLYTPVILLGTQSEKALRDRIEKDGSIKVFDGDYMAAVKAEAQKILATMTDDERQAMGAAHWISNQRYGNRASWVNVKQALGEGIKHPLFAEIEDTYEAAELVAADLTRDRRHVLTEAASALGTDLPFEPYEYDVPSLASVFPLLAHLDHYSLRRNEDLRVEALAYVNSKA